MAKCVLNFVEGVMATKHYLFDWGNTLMVDLPNQTGPMCEWPEVKAVIGAKDCLARVNQKAQCHLATNAQDSSQEQIRKALQRVGLSEYISHVFCRENLGVDKTNPNYYKKIIDKLNVTSAQVTMLGDSLERDVYPALDHGLNAIWFNPEHQKSDNDIQVIYKLSQLN
jgi:FMN phosphatase YigB (HAD superfamily)